MINEIKEFAKRLKDAAKWHSSEEAISHIEKKYKSDYVYEIYVYFRVLADLQKNYILTYFPGAKNNHYFPKKAGKKENFPHFKISTDDGTTAFQVCAGTKISSPYESETKAPDISFQKGDATSDPTYEDLLMIFDAKHKLDDDSKLPSDEVDVFIQAVRLYKLDKKDLPDIHFAELSGLLGNCLITNAKAHSADEDYIRDCHVKEVESFRPGGIFFVKGL